MNQVIVFAALVSMISAGCGADGDAVVTPPAFANPPELEPDENGVRTLRFGASEIEIQGQRYCVRAYNGVVPGPTIRIPAGTDRKVRVTLHNDFTQSDFREIASMEGKGPKSCHDFNVTNLHAHGSHIEPDHATADPDDPCTGDGCGPDSTYFADNVLLEVGAGDKAQYRWDFDEDGTHHAGTNWYHPHVHGATAIQVANGAAGALVIEGDIDEVPGVANATERIMVLSQIPIDSDHAVPLQEGEACTEDTLSVQSFLSVTELSPTLINGALKPRLVTPPGQVERWRFIYAASPDEMGLTLHVAQDPTCERWDLATATDMVQIARDGITLPQLYTNDTVWISPGYRVDAMVKMPAAKQTLCLVSRRVRDLQGSAIAIIDVDPAAGEPTEVSLPKESDIAAVAPPTTWTGVVDGQTMEVSCDAVQTIHQKLVLLMPTPGQSPPAPPEGSVELVSCDPAEYQHGHDPDAPVCICPDPNISCRKFGQRRARGYRSDRVATVGTSEKWQVMAFDGHPFHIHTNPFLVCPNRSNKEPNFPHWRDTYWVQAEDGPQELLMHFRKFAGPFVLHCHKLNHEDEGMMELVELCAEGDAECLCQGTDADGACISQAGCQADDLACQFAAEATASYPLPPAPDPALCGP